MSSKPQDVLDQMTAAYVDNTRGGKTSAKGVSEIMGALMSADPSHRITLLDQFESRVRGVVHV